MLPSVRPASPKFPIAGNLIVRQFLRILDQGIDLAAIEKALVIRKPQTEKRFAIQQPSFFSVSSPWHQHNFHHADIFPRFSFNLFFP